MNKREYQIRDITIDQFATFDDVAVESKKIDIGVDLSIEANAAQQLIIISTRLSFRSLGSTFITIQVTCRYHIKNENWEGWVDDEGVIKNIPYEFVENLTDLTVATTRGILFSKTEHTKFSKYLIPIISLSEALKVQSGNPS